MSRSPLPLRGPLGYAFSAPCGVWLKVHPGWWTQVLCISHDYSRDRKHAGNGLGAPQSLAASSACATPHPGRKNAS